MGRMLVAGIMVTAMLAAGPACKNKPRIMAQPAVEKAYEAGKMADNEKMLKLIPKKVGKTEHDMIDEKAAPKLDTIPLPDIKLKLKVNPTEIKPVSVVSVH